MIAVQLSNQAYHIQIVQLHYYIALRTNTQCVQPSLLVQRAMAKLWNGKSSLTIHPLSVKSNRNWRKERYAEEL